MVASHILAGIMGGLALLDMEHGAGTGCQTDIHEMMALVNRGAALSRQLLEFARRGKYDTRPLDLARVVAKTSAMYGRTRADLTITHDFAQDLLPVLMDHSQLEQVLLNLFVNAGQAMPEGGHLLLHGENAQLGDQEAAPLGVPSGRFVRLVVTDTGSGMDAKTLAKIFDPFFTTKGPGQGTGLGLASVYGIIRHVPRRNEVGISALKNPSLTPLAPTWAGLGGHRVVPEGTGAARERGCRALGIVYRRESRGGALSFRPLRFSSTTLPHPAPPGPDLAAAARGEARALPWAGASRSGSSRRRPGS